MPATSVALLGTVHADLWGFERLEAALESIRPRVIALETNPQRAALYGGRFDYDGPALHASAQATYARLLEAFQSDPESFRSRRARYRMAGVEWNERQVAAIEAGAVLLAGCYGFELKVAAKYVERHPRTGLRLIDLPEENVDAIRRSRGGETWRPSPAVLRLFAAYRDALDRGLAGYVVAQAELQDAYYADAGGALRRIYEQNVAGWATLPADDFYRRAMFDPRREPYMAEQLRRLHRETAGGSILAIVGATHVEGLGRLLSDLPLESGDLAGVPLRKAA